MIFSWMHSGIWKLIQQTDITSKIVLLILLGMSISCWAVFFYKLIIIKNKKNIFNELYHFLKQHPSEDQLQTFITHNLHTDAGAFLTHLMKAKQWEGIALDYPRLMSHAHDYIDSCMAHEESAFSVLSVSASVAPLLGLFGTVWGLIHSFVGISEQQSADIATIAPGIAEALITTLAGLIVAIPAVVMIGYLYTCLSHLEQKCMQVARQIVMILVHRR
jgi:biopolymer transport protein TolQ